MSTFWRKLWSATESVSVIEKAMVSYRKCLCFGESYGELQKVSPLWRKLWRVIGSVYVLEKAMESCRMCVRYAAGYGQL